MKPNQGQSPPDLKSPVGIVRLILGDTDPRPLDPPEEGQGTYMWYSDEEIEALLDLSMGFPRRAASRILRAIAVSQALKLKKWSSADLSVDGTRITDALLKAAAALDKEQDDLDEDGSSEFFALVPTGQPSRAVLALRYGEATDPTFPVTRDLLVRWL